MVIDNLKMAEALALDGGSRYYNWCADLSMAGKDYKVNDVRCFVYDEADPLSDFAQVKMYGDGFLLILIYTEKSELVAECMDYADTVIKDFPEVELRSPYPTVFKSERISSRYIVRATEYTANPVYYIRSADELAAHRQNEATEVLPYRGEADKSEIVAAVKNGRLDGKFMNADIFVPCTVFKDVKWYILRVNGEIAGYLRAECGYANIYNIGWLYVEPRFRGHGYAVDLVMYFSTDMFANNAIPHYGYAVSDASASVAKKCGYICDNVNPECCCLFRE